MKYYRCRKCGTDSSESELNNWLCPVCKSDEFWEIDHCSLCERNFDNDGDDDNVVYNDFCTECLEGIITDQTDLCLRYIHSDRQMEIDFFIKFYFQTEATNVSTELLDLCIKEFDETLTLGCWALDAKGALYDFITDDLQAFADWYEESRLEDK